MFGAVIINITESQVTCEMFHFSFGCVNCFSTMLTRNYKNQNHLSFTLSQIHSYRIKYITMGNEIKSKINIVNV
jgi:hypothetical protein